MNIVETRDTHEKEFVDICTGECFKYYDDYYLKIESYSTILFYQA